MPKEMKVWNHKISKEKEKVVTIKDLDIKIIQYKTTDGSEGIRVPLKDNGELMARFENYCYSLKDKLSEREKKFNLIQFSTFGEHDKGLDFFQMIGFYKLGNYLVFHAEPDGDKPLVRLTKFVEYYKKKFKLRTKPRKDLFNVLENLELIDDEEEEF